MVAYPLICTAARWLGGGQDDDDETQDGRWPVWPRVEASDVEHGLRATWCIFKRIREKTVWYIKRLYPMTRSSGGWTGGLGCEVHQNVT